MSASTKPPLSAGKEAAVHKLTTKKKLTSSISTVKHKGIHRSSSFSEHDESRTSSRSKEIEVGNSNSAIINSMEREINVSYLVEVSIPLSSPFDLLFDFTATSL